MKRAKKSTFIIVALLILGLMYTAVFGVYKKFGDRYDPVLRGTEKIRFGMDIDGGTDVTFGPADEEVRAAMTPEQLDQVREVFEKRLIGRGITDCQLYSDYENRQIAVRFVWNNGEKDVDPSSAISEISSTSFVEFFRDNTEDTEKPADSQLILNSGSIESAKAMPITQSDGTTNWNIEIILDDKGTAALKDATHALLNVGTLSIWVDGQAIINPDKNLDFTIDEGRLYLPRSGADDAKLLANLINSGPVPFAFEPKIISTVSPAMGPGALQAIALAGIAAFFVISIYLIYFYKLTGFVALFLLFGQTAASIAAVSGYLGFFNFNSSTLTLSGIAGILVAAGLGIAANLNIAERIKDELAFGKTVESSVRSGLRENLRYIFDCGVPALIIAAVIMGVFSKNTFWADPLSSLLFWIPTSVINAAYTFGYTLFIGVVFHILMNAVVSRFLFNPIARYKSFQNPRLYGGKKA
ncbi:MAG: hypothetical protein FWE80_05275 [Oscillospiraceae bacterium]|nr:hypothetical protein [Oscillospiraceae bacterium]